ncbi:hypothetical protein B0H14DRAFT_1039992 [Mycena olivaceomarginata]|nr:hypothetical protein B0H14DRAFT_1039992 [Mycena olivaceomarginata]
MRAEDTIHTDSDLSMADLVLAYNHATDAGWSLFSKTRRIISKKSLSSSDITDHSNDLSPPHSGIFRLEPHLFCSTESTVREMQELLTSVFSFVQGRPFCFVVDPHGVLLQMLRSAGSIYELQVAWKGLRERMEIAQHRFVEYQADCVAQSMLPTEFHAVWELSVPAHKSSVCVGAKDGDGHEPEELEDSVNRAEYTARPQSPTRHTPASVSVPSPFSGNTLAVTRAIKAEGHGPEVRSKSLPRDYKWMRAMSPPVPSITMKETTAIHQFIM